MTLNGESLLPPPSKGSYLYRSLPRSLEWLMVYMYIVQLRHDIMSQKTCIAPFVQIRTLGVIISILKGGTYEHSSLSINLLGRNPKETEVDMLNGSSLEPGDNCCRH